MEQYKHVDITITEETQARIDSFAADTSVSDSVDKRVRVLEEAVERQGRLIRDLQSMIQYLQMSR